MRPPEEEGRTDAPWGFLLGSVGLASLAAVPLTYLLWKVVPSYAAHYESLGGPVPRVAAYVIFLSNWFVRLLPLTVVFGSFGGGVLLTLALAAVAFMGVPARPVVRLAAGLALAVGLVEVALSFFVAYVVVVVR